jgi:hypothetical protein
MVRDGTTEQRIISDKNCIRSGVMHPFKKWLSYSLVVSMGTIHTVNYSLGIMLSSDLLFTPVQLHSPLIIFAS